MDFSLIPLFIIPALVLIAVSIAAKFMTVFLSARMQGINTLTSACSAIGLSSSCGELDLVMAKGGE
jgi:CPA2 family monovalent cation:H+ antiporter-2